MSNGASFTILTDEPHAYSVNPAHSQKIGNDRPRATLLQVCAANGTTILTFGTRQLTVHLGPGRWHMWMFIHENVPTGMLGIDFLQHYELLVDSRRLQLIDISSNNKSSDLKANTDAYQITGLLIDTTNLNACKIFWVYLAFPTDWVICSLTKFS